MDNQDKQLIIVGTGTNAEKRMPAVEANGYNVKYYVDNCVNKHGRVFRNRPIKPMIALLDEKPGATIVISSDKFKNEMIDQLKDLGLYYKHECTDFDDFEYSTLSPQFKCPNIKNSKRQDIDISILYDSQAFAMQDRGGVSRYFYEIIKRMVTEEKTSVSLFQGINRSCFDFSDIKDKLFNYYSEKTDIESINVRALINASLIWDYTCDCERFQIYHPTYYYEYPIINYSKMILTVHDMIHELFGLDASTIARKKRMIDKADAIIAVSECTKNDLINIYNIAEEKIKVVYEANSLRYEVNKKPEFDGRYILYVGCRDDYKNGELLISAFSNSKCCSDYSLVFMGGGEFNIQEKALIEKLHLENRVKHVNGDDATLANLYRYADFFVYPSLYEGFGLPILEAMHYGTPVITSNCSSMKEVAGDSAMFIDPNSEESLISAMDNMANSERTREYYSKKGYEREHYFSWDKCTNEIRSLYKRVLL